MKVQFILAVLSFAGTITSLAIKPRDDEDDETPSLIPISEAVDLEAAYFADLGAKRVKVRYGPLLVPGIHDPETMGMKEFSDPVEMPCTDCLITGFLAGLEFEDGSNANANTGMWLHHTAFLNLNQSDTTCPDYPSRFLASGNERTPLDLTNGGKRKAGLSIGAEDTIVQVTELMNESGLEREAYLTVEWEYIPASTPDFSVAKVIWLDVSGVCSENSGFEVDDAGPVFSKMMVDPYTIDFDAELLGNLGHLHDGGTHQTVYVNGWQVCDHVAKYGETEEYITHVGMYGNEEGEPHEHDEGEHEHGEEEHEHGEEEHEHGEEEHEHDEEEHEHDEDGHEHEHGQEPGEGKVVEGEQTQKNDKRQHGHDEGEEHGGHDHSTGEHLPHISSMSYCGDVGVLKAGDKLSITSFYDMNTHAAMPGHHGGLEPVMGITVLFVLPKTPDVEFEIESE